MVASEHDEADWQLKILQLYLESSGRWIDRTISLLLVWFGAVISAALAVALSRSLGDPYTTLLVFSVMAFIGLFPLLIFTVWQYLPDRLADRKRVRRRLRQAMISLRDKKPISHEEFIALTDGL